MKKKGYLYIAFKSIIGRNIYIAHTNRFAEKYLRIVSRSNDIEFLKERYPKAIDLTNENSNHSTK